MNITEDLVKQVFFYVNDKDPNGVYADNVNLKDFAEKLYSVMRREIAREEHGRCVKIVSSMNREVAKALQTQRP
jgi:hypothetical protein